MYSAIATAIVGTGWIDMMLGSAKLIGYLRATTFTVGVLRHFGLHPSSIGLSTP
jgi:hypothetical protein